MVNYIYTLNKNRLLVYNSEIIEWDIRSGNLSIIKEYNLLPEEKIIKIEKMKKQTRLTAVGIESRDNKGFSKDLESGFNNKINEFIAINELDKDYDILSIKRDAVFVVNRNLKHSKIGEHVEFIPKNSYHAYICIQGYEFYFKKNSIDIKGMNEDNIGLHTEGIISFLDDVIELLEDGNKKRLHSYLHDFVVAYKNRELGFDFYREFSGRSKFVYNTMGRELLLDNIDESLIDSINITFNYVEVILPVIQLICI